jgi:maltose alpha-D-glucosyltransferase / alpha-amylase
VPSSDPLWYKDAVVYELHVKAFFDSNDDGVGDFRGLIRKLDYVKDLGVTCLWLLPFYPSPLRDDGYDISDYHNVHPAYGTRRDFKLFVREAHRRGLRVITELVVNHTSDQHPWFQASRAAPPGSAKRDFYVWSDTDQKYKDARIIFTDTERSNWAWDPAVKAYYWHRFFSHQPDLNYDNPHVMRAVQRVMRFWLDMGVDGLRLDAVPYLVEREGTNCENLPETHAVLKALRRELDARHPGRLFLAEANQWPADVRPYFGDGDECHMAFHFPLMPRIFMALRQEDRHPITEILRQTPALPDNCQWALFLRNHDELTLEMVTDEDRDYMYSQYAADARMRLNIGIRRRLAPLVDNSRRRLELLTSLLLSFPGTPILYYGDEIRMGDNIYLGDRNGVRTPMQWSAERNAGFSRADPARLYSPPIMDPVYGYQAVNVEAQERDPSSFLNWNRRLIALRKQFKSFGRGTLEFLHPANRKVLAYVRRHGDETILCVANLSRFVQPAELDLSAFHGLVPVELMGRVEFPPIGEWPYFLTLGPHSFYWFQLQKPTALTSAIDVPVPVEQAESAPVLAVDGAWASLPEGKRKRALETEVLPPFLARQFWFQEKARHLRSARLADWAWWPEQSAYLLIVEAAFSEGKSSHYFVPLALAFGAEAESLLKNAPGCVVARVSGPGGGSKARGVLYDALADDAFCRALLEAARGRREVKMKAGSAGVSEFADADDALPPAEAAAAAVARESARHSNSTVVFGRRLKLKVFRRLEPGVNPDVEMSLALSAKADLVRVPALYGAMQYRRADKVYTLASLHRFAPNQGTAWSNALDELSRFYEKAAVSKDAPEARDVEAALRSESGAETLGAFPAAAAVLGRRVAELHLALASLTAPEFAPEPYRDADAAAFCALAREQARRRLREFEHHLGRLPEAALEPAYRLLGGRARLLDRLRAPSGLDLPAGKVRIHGDLRLGRALWAENDFVLLGFEGDSSLPIEERLQKQSPLKDVADVLRSLRAAADAGRAAFAQRRQVEAARLASWSRLWTAACAAAFLNAYRARLDGSGLLPPHAHFAALLEAHLVQGTLAELALAAQTRPEEASGPLEALLELLEGRPAFSGI